MPQESGKSSSLRQFKRIMALMEKRIWIYLVGMIGLAVTIAVCLQLFTAYKFKSLFDSALNGNISIVKRDAVEIAIAILIVSILSPIFSYICELTIQKTMARIRIRVFEKIERLPMSYFDKMHSSEIMSFLSNHLSAMEGAYFWPVLMTLIAVILGVGSTVMMLQMNCWIAVFTLIMGVISSLANTRFTKPMRKISDKIQESSTSASACLVDLFWGFNIIKIFKIGEILEKRFRERNREFANTYMKFFKLNAVINGANSVMGNITSIGVIVMGSILIANSKMSIGSTIACTQLFGGVSFMFVQLGSFMTQMQRSLAGASRIFALLDEQEESNGTGSLLCTTDDMIAFQDVIFSYDEGKTVLDGLSFSVPAGKTTALVGRSGCGKSTVFKLLLRFYRQNSGLINIYRKPIEHFTIEQIRDMIAYVPQDAYLFQGTIEENIRIGAEKASREDVIQAAKSAFAHDFIMELPKAYDTLVGENGARLSGGQRQRIAIARAVMKNAPILLLDEATSALDSKSEQIVQQALDALMKNRTTIVIAHRLSTISNADMIYVFENGKVTEQGKHKELLEAGGVYSRFFDLQFHGIQT